MGFCTQRTHININTHEYKDNVNILNPLTAYLAEMEKKETKTTTDKQQKKERRKKK